MGRAIKIPNVDFAAVSLGRVIFVEPIPCESIVLDKQSVTAERVGQQTQIIATVTPLDTTDALTWQSSNTNVATVENGLVTVHGIGTATITATCGTKSATASVNIQTLKSEFDYVPYTGMYAGTINLSEGQFVGLFVDETAGVGGQAYHNNDELRVKTNGGVVECIPVPYGATKMKFATTDGQSHSMNMVYIVDTGTLITENGISYPEYIRRPTFVNNATGTDVAFGEAFIFRAPIATIEIVSYIYFE